MSLVSCMHREQHKTEVQKRLQLEIKKIAQKLEVRVCDTKKRVTLPL